MIQDRKSQVLRAIVEDYVSTNEPVASKYLAERYQLGVSPATIRNDMAALEDEGYIVQPHTSAGRVPTDRGYRMFVDQLARVRQLTPAQRRAIEQFLEESVDLDDVIDRSVRLLAQLTNQVAMVQYPSLSRSTLQHLEIVASQERRYLVVIITNNGRVEQRMLHTEHELSADDIVEIKSRINTRIVGRTAKELESELEDLTQGFDSQRAQAAEVIADLIIQTLAESKEERIVISGTSNLARVERDFRDGLEEVLQALEEQVVLFRLLSQMEVETSRIAVRIGGEIDVAQLSGTSIVSSGYGADSTPLAHIAAIGPTRMNYPTTIAAVKAVAHYLSDHIGN